MAMHKSDEPEQSSFTSIGALLLREYGWDVIDDDDKLDEYVSASVDGEDTDDIWQSAKLDLLKASCAFFASEVLSGPPQPPYNGRFLVAEHHEAWDDLITSHDRVCVLAPRDHGKTFFFDFAYPIWKASFLANGKGYIFSATQDQAIRILDDIKNEIESNPKLAFLLPPSTSRNWSKTQITLANGHKIYARGYGTKIRGAHPDWIVVDDGLNDEDAYSEIVRNKNKDYFYTAITNMIVPGGQILVVGTPFHAADLYADLAKNEEYCFRRYPAINAKGDALWPERYSAAKLQRRRREIGNVRFAREFLCEPISDDMSLFPERLFRGEPTEQHTVKLGMSAKFWNELGVTRRYIGVDFALSSSTSADYTVIFVLGLDDAGNRWVVDILRKKGMPYKQQESLIHAVAKKYDPEMIFLESNQMQRIFGDELIRKSDLPIHKFITTGTGKNNKKLPTGNTSTQNKNSLEGGVPSLRTLLENGKFRIPRGDARSVEMTELWISEMKAFTWLDGKVQGVGSHDDTVMACWIADQAARRGGFNFSTGDEDDLKGVSLEQQLEESMQDVPEQDEEFDPEITEMLGVLEDDEEVVPRMGSLVDDDDLMDDDDAWENIDRILAKKAWRSMPGLNR